MNILVTGANGFIGKAFVKNQLSIGNRVFAIVSNKSEMDDIDNINLISIQLMFDEYEKISKLVNEEIDIAYHFAWSGLYGSEAKNINCQLSSISATLKLLIELKKLNTKKIVFASTMNTIELRNLLTYPTEYKTRGVHVHVSAKIMASIVARNYCEENRIDFNEGIIAMAYGENNHSRMITNVFIYSLLNGIKPKLVEGNNQYDIIYIDDIVSAMNAIGTKGINKKSYYIGHNWNKTFKEIFSEIRDILSPNQELTFGDYPDDNKIDFSIINRSELFNDTGWTASTPFVESIIKTAKWIKKSGIKFC